jgi:PIN domain nuclease of toxin-antitoxin system
MRLLLDTHVFIWAAVEPAKLSAVAADFFQDRGHELILSVVSVWEMQIKHQVGKLTVLTQPIAEVIASQQEVNGIELMPVVLEHALGLEQLPMHHRDPFDRLLVAQAMIEQMPFLSNDAQLVQYPVQVIW